jgi:hypothetical protein
LPDRYVEDLAATPWGLFAGTDAGVYRFDSTSATWVASGLEAHIVAALAYVPRSEGYLLAGVVPANVEITAASVFASMDTGLTWVPWDNDWSDSADGRLWAFALSVDPLDPSHILWGGEAHIGESTDGGATWDIVWGTVTGLAQGIHAVVFPAGTAGPAWAVGNSAFGGGYVMRSTNRGETWQQLLPVGESEIPFWSGLTDPVDADRFWIGLNGGVMVTPDGGTQWEPSLRDAGAVRGLAAIGSTVYAAAGTIGLETELQLYRLPPNATEWESVPVPASRGAWSMISDGNQLLIGTDRAGVWRYKP